MKFASSGASRQFAITRANWRSFMNRNRLLRYCKSSRNDTE